MRKRDNNLNIRLDDKEIEHFMTEWKKSGLSKAEFLMKLLDESHLNNNIVLSSEEKQLPKEF